MVICRPNPFGARKTNRAKNDRQNALNRNATVEEGGGEARKKPPTDPGMLKADAQVDVVTATR
jgi:hypothetical protein